MLKKVIIKDFFAFNGRHTVDLNPGINLLLGINGSGKTSFINALRFLHEGVCGYGVAKLMRQFGGCNSVINALGPEKKECFSLTFVFDAEILKSKFSKSPFLTDPHYRITVFPMGDGSSYSICESLFTKDKNGGRSNFRYLDFKNGVGEISTRNDEGNVVKEKYSNDEISAQELVLRQITDPLRYLPSYIIRAAVNEMAIYGKFNVETLRNPSEPTQYNRLNASGDNLAYLYSHINNNHSLKYDEIKDELRSINPTYSDLGFNIFGSMLYLYLKERHLSHAIDISRISDGTLKFLILMGIFFNPERGYLCALDEPEAYLHPDMTRSVARMMKKAAKTSQLIVATHSPLLLNSFHLSDILVFQKDPSNSLEVKRGDEAYEDNEEDTNLLPGQLWLSGRIGGTRW